VYDLAWLAQPLTFQESLAGSGGVKGPGLALYRAGISNAIADGTYKTEADLFYDTDLRPAGSTLVYWRALSHDLWINSAQYKADYDAAQAVDYSPSTPTMTASPSGFPAWAKALAVVGVILVGVAVFKK
jgi:hypothetical protein